MVRVKHLGTEPAARAAHEGTGRLRSRRPASARGLLAALGSGLMSIVVAGVMLRGSLSGESDRREEAAVSCQPLPSATVSPDTSRPRSPAGVAWVEVVDAHGRVKRHALCQTRCLMGVDCDPCRQSGESRWSDRRIIPWELFAQGEYVGPYRDLHVPEYRIRVDDDLEFVYRLTRVESNHAYELNVGDKVRVESMTDPTLDRELVIQPDGMITLRMLGQIRAARRTVTELRDDLEEQYQKYYKVPAITVTPLQVNTRLEDLRAAVDSRFGQTGGQAQQSRVTPEGTIQLPGIGSVIAQGLTLDELKQEIDERYAQLVDGIGVTPRLLRRAPRFVYVVGEVRQPGRYTLEAPTTSMQAITLAGGWNNGGNLRHIVVFRRTDDWRLIATKLDLRGAAGRTPLPGRRGLAARQRYRGGPQEPAPENQRLHRTALHARDLRRDPHARRVDQFPKAQLPVTFRRSECLRSCECVSFVVEGSCSDMPLRGNEIGFPKGKPTRRNVAQPPLGGTIRNRPNRAHKCGLACPNLPRVAS